MTTTPKDVPPEGVDRSRWQSKSCRGWRVRLELEKKDAPIGYHKVIGQRALGWSHKRLDT